MHVVTSLESIPKLPSPIVLTIGNFDGVHEGHQYLLSYLKKLGTPVVVTFTNHTKAFLSQKEIPLLTSFDEKIALLEDEGVACIIALPFTEEIANTSYDTFLRELHHKLPFSSLVLGEGEALGKNRAGTPEKLSLLGEQVGFKAHFVPKLTQNGKIVSSSALRNNY